VENILQKRRGRVALLKGIRVEREWEGRRIEDGGAFRERPKFARKRAL